MLNTTGNNQEYIQIFAQNLRMYLIDSRYILYKRFLSLGFKVFFVFITDIVLKGEMEGMTLPEVFRSRKLNLRTWQRTLHMGLCL